MADAYGSNQPAPSTTRQVSRGKETAGQRYAGKAARRGQSGTAKAVEPARITPPPAVSSRVVSFSLGAKITGEIGRYAGTLFGINVNASATGNLTSANLGTAYDACDVWYPPEIGASEAKLASGTVGFGWLAPVRHATRNRPIVIAMGIGGAGGSGTSIARCEVVSLDSSAVANVKPFGSTGGYTPQKVLLCQGHAAGDSVYVATVESTPVTGVTAIEIFTLTPSTEQFKLLQVIDGYGRLGFDFVRAT